MGLFKEKKLEVGEGCQNLTIGWLLEKVKDYEGCGRRRLPEITQDGWRMAVIKEDDHWFGK